MQFQKLILQIFLTNFLYSNLLNCMCLFLILIIKKRVIFNTQILSKLIFLVLHLLFPLVIMKGFIFNPFHKSQNFAELLKFRSNKLRNIMGKIWKLTRFLKHFTDLWNKNITPKIHEIYFAQKNLLILLITYPDFPNDETQVVYNSIIQVDKF